jgi:toxin YoeB
MEIEFTQRAFEDLQYWRNSSNSKILKRISELTASIIQAPFAGIGKPEPLKHQFSGKWSRRISREHRYIYEVRGGTLYIFSLRGHYK